MISTVNAVIGDEVLDTGFHDNTRRARCAILSGKDGGSRLNASLAKQRLMRGNSIAWMPVSLMLAWSQTSRMSI
ncbi:MAG: hypothetical protein U0V48_01060 [Anaerolineales bacterium]